MPEMRTWGVCLYELFKVVDIMAHEMCESGVFLEVIMLVALVNDG